MRILAALALTAATLASAPVAASEPCEMGRAIYTLKEAPGFRLEFRPDREMQEVARTASPTIYSDVRASMRVRRGPEIAEFVFYAPSYSTAKTQVASVTSSRYLENKPFPVIALNADFSRAGIPYNEGAAPAALLIPGLAEGLAAASASLPEGNARSTLYGMPEGAWILSACR
ncbi:hypothetical protein [Parvibaculum sp.]|uniref:hypothetical protein n=1 Tax=Parvibaculum sp. TaxID=2024848 RepID=UPI003919F41E